MLEDELTWPFTTFHCSIHLFFIIVKRIVMEIQGLSSFHFRWERLPILREGMWQNWWIHQIKTDCNNNSRLNISYQRLLKVSHFRFLCMNSRRWLNVTILSREMFLSSAWLHLGYLCASVEGEACLTHFISTQRLPGAL